MKRSENYDVVPNRKCLLHTFRILVKVCSVLTNVRSWSKIPTSLMDGTKYN